MTAAPTSAAPTSADPTSADHAPSIRGGVSVSRQQADIVDSVCRNSFTVVDAGAGSGKTRTTVATVLQLLDIHPELHVDHFVLITFTNQAADELRGRLEDELVRRLQNAAAPEEHRRWVEARERLPNAYIGTIHSFCRQILRTFGYGSLVARESEVEFSRGLLYESVTDAIEESFEKDANHPLRAELGTGWHTYDLERIVREIYDDVRNRGLSPDDVLANTQAQPKDNGKPVRVALAQFMFGAHIAYAAKKHDRHLLDAADLLRNTADVLLGEEGFDVATKLAERYSYLFVDEFQDTDRVQLQIVDALRSVLKGVLLVGDEKQSIYRFRGAGMRLSQIARERGTKPLVLNFSSRPTRQLLDLQNALFKSIAGNYPGLDQPLEAFDEARAATTYDPPAITYLRVGDADDIDARTSATADKIRQLLGRPIITDKGHRIIAPGDIAILLRANESVDAYEAGLREALVPHGVVVRKKAGGQFFRRPEVIAIHRILRLLVDHPSDVVLAQAIWTGLLGCDIAAVERDILRFGAPSDYQLTRWFEENHAQQAATLRELRAALRSDSVSEIVERTYRALAIREHYQDLGRNRAVDNLDRLREMARDLTPNDQASTLRGFVHWLQVRLLGEFDEPDAGELSGGDARPNYVRIMTVHQAKGSEFPIVFIPEVQKQLSGFAGNQVQFIVGEEYGLDVRLLLRTPTESQFFAQRTFRDAREERYEAMRVFYVAVTRAQNAVIFVGSGPAGPAREPNEPGYAWRDEIRRAWPSLKDLGATFEEARSSSSL
jgi:DNA helicase-2/ATP-dependent DNA helicase PcrA